MYLVSMFIWKWIFFIKKNLGWEDVVIVQDGENLWVLRVFINRFICIYLLSRRLVGFEPVACQIRDTVLLHQTNPLGFGNGFFEIKFWHGNIYIKVKPIIWSRQWHKFWIWIHTWNFLKSVPRHIIIFNLVFVFY